MDILLLNILITGVKEKDLLSSNSIQDCLISVKEQKNWSLEENKEPQNKLIQI